MNRFSKEFFQSMEKIALFLAVAVALAAFVFGGSARPSSASKDEAPESDLVSYFLQSPVPTSTFTPSPSGPTDTPPPPTATDTPTPTGLPPTATDTPTPTGLPPTATDTPTPTQLPPTATDTPTPTQLPPTATDTPTPTQLPPTPTDTPTPTPIPNEPPEILSIVVDPFDGVAQIDTKLTFTAVFTDPWPVNDVHVATWNWGDGSIDSCPNNTVECTVDQGNYMVTGSHAYSEPGVYTVSLTVTDSAGAFDTGVYEFVIIYDPSGGFITGSGWILSPAAAYRLAPSLMGKANFGFVSKYQKGAGIPTGNTQFQFQAADMKFHSDNYQWLVITGGNTAKFKGTGTINGEAASNGQPYYFQVWARDDDLDTFRIKIWWEDSNLGEAIAYDNGFDQTISGGSIVVHSGK